jgi:hypothetical protein
MTRGTYFMRITTHIIGQACTSNATFSYGTALALQILNRDTKAAPAASYKWLQGEQAMAKPHDTQNHEVCQEHPLVTELLAELQAIDEKGRVEARFYELIA